jgi:hypothetical protein
MISVMATRCRHCGEKVSRPKTSEEHFTIQDLGGVSGASYRVSEHVMGALEAFRAEELNAGDSSGHGKNVIELDAAHRALAEAVTERPEERARRQALRRPVRKQDDSLRNVALVLAVAAGLVVLVVGGMKVQQYFASQQPTETPVYVNQALDWLRDGQHTTLQALEEANRALRQAPNPENHSIAETVRAALQEEVRELVRTVPWDRDKLSRASAMANRAAEVDPSRTMQDLRNEVQREVAAFKVVLTKVDEATQTATFTINDPYYTGDREQVVKVGDYLAGRFLIRAIGTSQVEFVDERVVGPDGTFRRLSVRVLDPVRGLP